MVYLSDVLNLPVLDSQGQAVGVVTDLVVNMSEAFPVVAALVVTPSGNGRMPGAARPSHAIVPWRQVVSIEEPRLRLTVPRSQLHTYSPRAGDIFLARDILDKQIVDTQGRRVVKVNDLKLAQVRGVARLLGADISFWAFFRRLLPFRFNERLVTWNYVQPIEQDPRDVHLRVPQTSLNEMHPADLADLLEDMHPDAGVALLNSLDVETAADAVQEMEQPFQAPLVEEMATEKASDLLEAMPPDEAADIIGDLPEQKAQEILANMQPEPAQEVKELLQYDEHTAGGRMTPDVFTLASFMTAQEAIEKLRTEGPPPETTYYLFVVSPAQELVGIVSLRALVSARPTTLIDEIMQRDVISVNVNDDQETVAGVIRKYNLLGVPVVDDHKALRGLVTVGNVLDVMHEESTEDMSMAVGTAKEDIDHTAGPLQAARGRLVWILTTIAGGLIAGVILDAFRGSFQSTLPLVFFLPLIIAVAHVVGTQSVAVADRADLSEMRAELWKEMAIGILVGVFCGAIVGVIASFWMGTIALGAVVGISLTITLVIATVLGAVSPLVVRRLGLHPAIVGGPTVDAINSVISVLLYVSLATVLLHFLT
jgi:magnesium transporter